MSEARKDVSILLLFSGVLSAVFLNPLVSPSDSGPSVLSLADGGEDFTISYPSSFSMRSFIRNSPLYDFTVSNKKNQDALKSGAVLTYKEDTDPDSYAENLLKRIQNGTAEDVYMVEERDLPYFLNSSCALDLVHGLGMDKNEFSYQFPYVRKAGEDAEGNLRASCFEVSSGLLAYNRLMARKVFGTDEPSFIQEKFKDFTSINESSAFLKEKGYYFSSSYADDLDVFYSSNSSPLVTSEKKFSGVTNLIQPEESRNVPVTTWLGEAKYLSENGYCHNTDRNEHGSWDRDHEADSKVFSFFLSSEEVPAFISYMDANGTKGNWGLVAPSNRFRRDHYYLLVNPKCDNMTYAREFVRDLTTNQTSLLQIAQKQNVLVNSASAVENARENKTGFDENVETSSGTYSEYFRQDALKLYLEAAQDDPLSDQRTEYDKKILAYLSGDFASYIRYTEDQEDFRSFSSCLSSFRKHLKSIGVS